MRRAAVLLLVLQAAGETQSAPDSGAKQQPAAASKPAPEIAPFYAVGTLAVRREGRAREFLLRFHWRGDDTALALADGPRREAGTVVLWRKARVYLWFSRAEVEFSAPAEVAGGRIFGSDFEADDFRAIEELLRSGGTEPRRTVRVSQDSTTRRELTVHPRAGAEPARLEAKTIARDGRVESESSFLLRFLEQGSTVRAELFEPENLKLWR
jgi:hypothetical protein